MKARKRNGMILKKQKAGSVALKLDVCAVATEKSLIDKKAVEYAGRILHSAFDLTDQSRFECEHRANALGERGMIF